MASEAEAWWAKSYTNYSIRDLQALPIFNKFVAQHFPYKRDSGDSCETYTIEPKVKTLEWAHKTRDEGEKLWHDHSQDIWFYEHRFFEGEVHVTTQTWLDLDSEWGEITKKYKDFDIHEVWRLKESERRYERFTIEDGEKRGIRTGRLPALDGMETWAETYWEQGDETEMEKVWTRPDASGGENQHKRGSYWWGEVWHKAGEGSTEKKSWHTQGDHEWGHIVGEACAKSWNEKWDNTKEKRNEERLTQEGDRRRGFRYIRDGADWYRQEWDGLRILGLDEGIDLVKKIEFVEQLDEVMVSGHDTVLRGEHTLEMLLREAQEFEDEVESLKRERLDIPKPDTNDPEALFAAIRTERELADKQEQLKERMINAAYTDHGKYCQFYVTLERLLKASQATYKTLSQALKHDARVTSDCEGWAKTLEKQRRRRNVSNYDRDVMAFDSLLAIEKEKSDHLQKFVGGMAKTDVQKAMDSMYQIMVKHDAVSDKIVELVQDQELKQKLDSFEAQFESIHSSYSQKLDPDLLHENLALLMDYQPIHLHLVGRLRGYEKDEVTHELDDIKGAVDESRGTATLKKVRSKVRSGRGKKDSPFQLVDRDLNRIIPFVLRAEKAMRCGLEASNGDLLASLERCQSKSVDDGEPFEIIIEKAAMLAEAVGAMEGGVAGCAEAFQRLEDLEQEVRDLEEIINVKSTEISELTTRLDEKENYIRQLEFMLIDRETLKDQVDALTAETAQLKASLALLFSEKSTLEAQLQADASSLTDLQAENQQLKDKLAAGTELPSEP